jgi:hypothetical protein
MEDRLVETGARLAQVLNRVGAEAVVPWPTKSM